ncbi:MAG: hypothetical protein U0796_02630 [Gemmatales bacterium]
MLVYTPILIAISMVGGSHASDQPLPSVATAQTVRDAILANRKLVTTLAVHYSQGYENLLDMKELKTLLDLDYLCKTETRYYWKDGRVCVQPVDQSNVPGDVMTAVQERHHYIYSGGPSIVARVYREKRPNPIMYQIHPLTNFYFMLQPVYLVSTGFTSVSPIAGSPPGIIDSDVVSLLASLSPKHQLPQEMKGNVQCVVVESASKRKFWLDPRRGYAVLAQQIWEDGKIKFEIDCSELRFYSPGIWLPHRVNRLWLAHDKTSGTTKRAVNDRIVVHDIKLNTNIDTALIDTKIPPKAQVADFTLKPTDSKGEPSKGHYGESVVVSYQQPPEAKDLQLVKEMAQRRAGRAAAELGFADAATYMTWSVGVLVLLILVTLMWRWAVQRRRSVQAQPN